MTLDFKFLIGGFLFLLECFTITSCNGLCHIYLLNRKQYVVVEGASSDITSVVSGVPQGSVLAPLLFLTYLNSVNSLVLTKGTQITMYADDILLVNQSEVLRTIPICRKISLPSQTAFSISSYL